MEKESFQRMSQIEGKWVYTIFLLVNHHIVKHLIIGICGIFFFHANWR
jgi:hypothetical protein